MSLESARQFLDDVKTGKSEIDMKEIEAIEKNSDKLNHVLSKGYDFTAEEVIEASNKSNFHGKKITMEGAQLVAGGTAVNWITPTEAACAAQSATAAACA